MIKLAMMLDHTVIVMELVVVIMRNNGNNGNMPFNSQAQYKQWVSDTYCQGADANDDDWDNECEENKDCNKKGQINVLDVIIKMFAHMDLTLINLSLGKMNVTVTYQNGLKKLQQREQQSGAGGLS